MDVIEQHEAEARADTGPRWQQIPRMGGLVLGGLEDGQRQVGKPWGVVSAQSQGDLHTFVPSGSGTALGPPIPVGFGGALLANRRQVGLAVGVGDLGEECSALARQRETASEAVAGRTQRRRIARGRRAQATAEQDGHLVGIELISFGWATVHGLQREGRPQDKSEALLGAQVGEPIPGEHALDGHAKPLAVRGARLEQGFGSGGHVAVQQDCASVMHDAAIQAPRVESNPTVKGVLVGVEAHEVAPLSPVLDSQCQHTTGVC
jgi:hypothetical protein